MRHRKATDEQLATSYKELASLKKVANLFGMCGQSVHERLAKLHLVNKIRKFSQADKDRLCREYEGFVSVGRLHVLAKEMGRTKNFLARQARSLGLTNPHREKPYISDAISISRKEWYKNNPHPRGMLGKTHSDKTKDEQSQRSFDRWHSMTDFQKNQFQNMGKRSWKSGWRTIGGTRSFYRSSWEANYARYLEWLRTKGKIIAWEHELTTFWFHQIKRGTRSYLPDFAVMECNGKIVLHEVKGWLDAGSKTKLRRMAKYYPHVPLVLIDAKSYKSIAKTMSLIIGDWE